MASLHMRIGSPGRKMLISVMGFLAVLIVFYQFLAFSSEGYFSDSFSSKKMSSFVSIRSIPMPGSFEVVNGVNMSVNGVWEGGEDSGVASDGEEGENDVVFSKDVSMRRFSSVGNGVKHLYLLDKNFTGNDDTETVSSPIVESIENGGVSEIVSTALSRISVDEVESLGAVLNTSGSIPSNRIKLVVDLQAESAKRVWESSLKNESLRIERYVRKMRGATTTIAEMKSMLFNGPASSTTVKRGMSSPRDRELFQASLQIKNAPVLRDFPDLHAPLFRNASVFKRSYELMVRLLKIYVYKEGEKPIFHQPRVRGIYAAEGWFMKLMERSKLFVVRDPKKAHLFYLPFSSQLLRMTLHDEKSYGMKELEHYLKDYVDVIKKRHSFWNRTGGADHFFVACHDWGPRITSQHMSSCIRALCNTNIARGFSIGKDVSVPVTYVRSGNDPTRDIGGKPALERHILAFFAGQIHGYLRPLLLNFWENKIADMKILGPMQRNVESKAVYREYMKSSKYCICARGYGVHTPRVVESIFYECVPVIISDNYVPPFFEVLDWEAFAVFVQEKDIPNLRDILLSIPEDRYLDMHKRVKLVQRHFIWHKIPEKYDLFHMILHSIWYSRVSRMRPS